MPLALVSSVNPGVRGREAGAFVSKGCLLECQRTEKMLTYPERKEPRASRHARTPRTNET